jgi:hypothetical protein
LLGEDCVFFFQSASLLDVLLLFTDHGSESIDLFQSEVGRVSIGAMNRRGCRCQEGW